MQAEFSGGVLVCNGVVAVRRVSHFESQMLWHHYLISLQTEGGRICLEGAVCEDYYIIRQLLYEQFAII